MHRRLAGTCIHIFMAYLGVYVCIIVVVCVRKTHIITKQIHTAGRLSVKLHVLYIYAGFIYEATNGISP